MKLDTQVLGEFVKAAREEQGLTQDQLIAAVCPSESRTLIALFEQGRRLPSKENVEKFCRFLKIPGKIWQGYIDDSARLRLQFEEALSELVGEEISGVLFENSALEAIEELLQHMFAHPLTREQGYHYVNRLLAAYRILPMRRMFYDTFLGPDALKSTVSLHRYAEAYQKQAIRLFSTFAEAYERLNSQSDINELLRPLKEVPDKEFADRDEWDPISQVPEDRLEDLGYISATKLKREEKERRVVSDFLRELAADIRKKGKSALDERSDIVKRRMDSYLRSFHSVIEHGLFSSLFVPDPDVLEKEAARLAPVDAKDFERIAGTQQIAQRNLAKYLTADFIDVYVATSMRGKADFVSVNRFVSRIFAHDDVRSLKLRYFNPTQSWIDDRVAKGLVEALMLKRSRVTIYMAQKGDTFGKDSEASVALGQGKPVIVYVPKLVLPGVFDTEAMGRLQRMELVRFLDEEGIIKEKDIDDAVDNQALLASLIEGRLRKAAPEVLHRAVIEHWADFDLEGEAVRVQEPAEREAYHQWISKTIGAQGEFFPPTPKVREWVERILVANAITFESRAQTFRAVHPLALQVILSSGMLNGIVVVRSVDSCAALLRGLLLNKLDLRLETDDKNYRLVENSTRRHPSF